MGPQNHYYSMALFGGFVSVVLLLAPWYLAGTELKTGLAAGPLGICGAVLSAASAGLVMAKNSGRYEVRTKTLTTEQLALTTATVASMLLLLRVLFKPDFGLSSTVGTESTYVPLLALGCSCLTVLSFYKLCMQTPAGLPFRHAFQSASLPPRHESIEDAPGLANPPAGWFEDPSGKYDERFFDGASWTARVRTDAHELTDLEMP